MQARHILPLTGIRLFAAVWVVLYHFNGSLAELLPFSSFFSPFFGLGYQAVPLFFLLSGFILSDNYFPDYSFSKHYKFLFLRFARLWPVHFAALTFLIFGPVLIHLDRDSALSLAEELLMVRSWFHTDLPLNYPAWSISAEWFAYIFLFPAAFMLFKRMKSRTVLVILVTLLLAAQAFVPSKIFPGRCGDVIFIFLAGSGLYRIYYLTKNPPAEAITLCGALLLVSYLAFNKHLTLYVLYIAFALLIYGLSYERGFIARILSTKIAVQGGLMSYSLYMIQFLVLRSYLFFFWGRLPHSLFLRFIVFLLLAGALAGTTAIFYYCIEVPANKRLRHLISNPLPPLVRKENASG